MKPIFPAINRRTYLFSGFLYFPNLRDTQQKLKLLTGFFTIISCIIKEFLL